MKRNFNLAELVFLKTVAPKFDDTVIKQWKLSK